MWVILLWTWWPEPLFSVLMKKNVINWNCVRKQYQQPQICRWQHSKGRKGRTKWAFWSGWKRKVKKLARNSALKKLRSWIQSWHFMANRRRKGVAVIYFLFLGSKITVDVDCRHEIKRHLLLERKAMTNQDRMLKSRHHLANKGLNSQSHGLSNNHVWMWELDHKEDWVPKN